MPELPEVETIRRKLKTEIIGRTIKSVEILEPKQFFGDPQTIIGKKVTDILRKGKYLSIALSDNLFINIHLKMSGQIIWVEDMNNPVIKNPIPRLQTNRLPASITRVIIKFTDNSALFYNDMRKFGWVKIGDAPEGPKSADVAGEEFTLEYFQKVLKNSRKPIKTFLLDQDKLAGVGNIYDNDALWVAQIHPSRLAGALNEAEQKQLYEAIKEVIAEGIKYGGSSARDENYIMPDGSLGEYQKHFKVYHRHGQPCHRCGEEIKRITIGGRGTFYCPKCQLL
ncbi:MAG: bifunctional DNA-formamidopyrimidine glycosylase/DNA-(apurinic or apyrimidinic site) lyase [Weeksellaceae bacterium]